MPAWPGTLPQYVLEEGFTETLPKQTTESQVDSGPPKVRRRFTKNYRPVQASILCTIEQAATFETFFETDLAGGSLSFTWVNPITQLTASFRFREPPRKTYRGGAVMFSLNLWQLN